MSDIDSSLPVRTQNPGDVIAKLADATTPSQQLAIDSSGRITTKMDDGSGNPITSQANGSQRALDVGIDVAGVQIDPRDIRALTSADVVTVDQGTTPFITKDGADGPVTPGAAASNSILIGGQYNTSLPTLTNGQQSALQSDSSGRLLVSTTLSEDQNYGTVGANTLRTAAQIGNATGAADFNAGATTAQTLRTTANISDSNGNAFSITNPLFVQETTGGTSVTDFKDASAIAGGSSDNHDYTVTAGKTLSLFQIESSASGKAKMTLEIETGVGTNTFVTKAVQFNSTATPNMSLEMDMPIMVAAGVRVRVVMLNRETAAEDLYSTIIGTEQ